MENKVLIVEDDPLNILLIRDLLQISGYEVLEANDGETAVELALKHLPDLILMDIQMPIMDGLEATRRIKREASTCKIPVIALTAYAMKGDEEMIAEAGCDGYLTKPIDTRSFLTDVASFLKKNTTNQDAE